MLDDYKKRLQECLIQKKNFNQDVIILGTLNMDLNLKTNPLPKFGETFEGSSFYVKPGGKGGNQAVVVSRSSKLKKFNAYDCYNR